MNDFTPRTRRVRMEDGRTGTEHRAPVDSLWSITLDTGEVLYRSVLREDTDVPYTYLED